MRLLKAPCMYELFLLLASYQRRLAITEQYGLSKVLFNLSINTDLKMTLTAAWKIIYNSCGGKLRDRNKRVNRNK